MTLAVAAVHMESLNGVNEKNRAQAEAFKASKREKRLLWLAVKRKIWDDLSLKNPLKYEVSMNENGKIWGGLLWVRAIGLFFLLAWFTALPALAGVSWPKTVASKDGTPISYEVFGKGDPSLVFVHGWSCDSRYWRAQVPYFSKKYTVVVLDLAGHGHSGLSRVTYSMEAFGEDVRAVTEATQSERVILIGHSMGGAVISEAARLMPERVLGLIGVDTLQDVEYAMSRKKMDEMTSGLKKDFAAGCRGFVETMFRPGMDKGLSEWILSDMSSAPPAVALSAMNEMLIRYMTGEAATVFEAIKAPVICVNADLWPVNSEANKRHMQSFEAIMLENTGHFLMMAQPERFNPALEKAVQKLAAGQSH